MILLAAPLHAQTVALHHGSVNPVTTGWTYDPAAGSVAGPILDGGVPAWSVRTAWYGVIVPPSVVDQLTAQGWVLTVIARAVDPTVVGPTTPVLFYLARGWSFRLGYLADGRPYVMLTASEPYPIPPGPTGPAYILTGDPRDYHRFDLICPPASNLASLHVDGVLRIADHPGYAHAMQRGSLYFGAWDPLGRGDFAHVELRIGAEVPVAAESASWGAIKAHYRD